MSESGDTKKKVENDGISTADRAKEKLEAGDRAWKQSEIFDISTEIKSRQAEETKKAEEVEEAQRKEEWDWEEHKNTKKVAQIKKSNHLKYWVVITLASLAASALIFLHSQFFSNG